MSCSCSVGRKVLKTVAAEKESQEVAGTFEHEFSIFENRNLMVAADWFFLVVLAGSAPAVPSSFAEISIGLKSVSVNFCKVSRLLTGDIDPEDSDFNSSETWQVTMMQRG